MIKARCFFILVIVFFLITSCTQQHKIKTPNFLFILVDDLGYMDVGCYNPNTFYETPCIDQMALEGVRFTNAYAASPVCSPTRASILTGKYPVRMATTDYFGAAQPEEWARNTRLLPASYVDELPLEEITIAEVLRENGYSTFFAGKWHLGEEGFWPENQGFDINKGGCSKGGPYGGKMYFSPFNNPRLKDSTENEHLPDRLARETTSFIEKNKEKPFFAYLSFYSVHTPLVGRPDLVKKYQKKKEQLQLPDSVWGKEGYRKLRLVQNHAVYAAMVEAMDQAVGKVMNKLKELKLDKNTVVIFMSDNGGLSTSEGHPTCNLPLRAGKGWLYEGGIREPMIIKWPGNIQPGSIDETPVVSTDFYPTILEMAKLPSKQEQHIDGVSLVPLLKQEGAWERDAIFWHYPHFGNQGGSPGSAVRKGNYKLIEFFGDKPLELYDLEKDSSEYSDLSDIMPDKVNELKTLLLNWQEEVGARVPTENKRFDPEKEEYY